MDLVIYTLRSIAYVIAEPFFMVTLFILGLVLFKKNRRVTAMQRMIIGEEVNSALELTLSQIVLGIFAGTFASIVLSYLGVIFNENSGIEFLLLISILLMFIKPKFICFSYSGAILGTIGLLFTCFNIKTSEGIVLFDLDIAMLMTLVGVLHAIEGILVMFDGCRGAVPVFSNRNGRIIGGYALKRNWLIPIAIFVAYNSVSQGSLGTESINTPSWWPILSYDNIINLIQTSILTLTAVFGVIGYSSVTFTRKKREKCVSSGLFILGYGILLSLVAQLANFGLVFKVIVIIFAPLAHEGMTLLQKKIEDKREPLFMSDEEGLAVLEVVPFSKAYELGIRAGDKIVLVNNKIINSEADIYGIIKESFNNITLKVRDKAGQIREFSFKHERNRRLGVVLVPKFVDMDKVVSFEADKFSKVLKDIKDKNNK